MSRALEQAAEWIVRLNDAGASERDFAEWQTWMAKNPANTQAFQELQDTWRRSASVAQAPSEEPAAASYSPRFRYALAASIATLAVAVGLTAFFWFRPQTIETATTELRSLKLSDGTRISLGPETHVELSFSRRERLVKMSGGEAYFNVERAPGRPFSVQTSAGLVTALGTAFSIRADGDRLAVSVTEGSVRVDSGASSPVIRAGQKYIHDGARTETTSLSSVSDATAWQDRRLEYQGEPLRVVISDINRYSRTKLRLEDPALRELRYTGTVFPDTLDAWLASIEGVFPLRVEEGAGERRLVPAK